MNRLRPNDLMRPQVATKISMKRCWVKRATKVLLLTFILVTGQLVIAITTSSFFLGGSSGLVDDWMQLSTRSAVGFVLMVILVAPIFESYLFIFVWFLVGKVNSGKWFGALSGGVFFALLHDPTDLSKSASTLFAGVVYYLAYLPHSVENKASERVLNLCAVHALNNAAACASILASTPAQG